MQSSVILVLYIALAALDLGWTLFLTALNYRSVSRHAGDVPEDFLVALEADAGALAFFRGLNRANVYAIAWRLRTAKTPEARRRRFEALLAMMKNGEKLH